MQRIKKTIIFTLILLVGFFVFPAYAQHNRSEAKRLDDWGQYYYKQGKIELALAALRKAIEADNTYAPSHAHLGQIFYEYRNLDQATIEFETAIKLDPTVPDYPYKLGKAWNVRGSAEKAIKYLTVAVNLDAKNPDYKFEIAQAYQKQGKPDEAVKNLKEALKLKKDLYKANLALGKIYKDQQKYKEAAEEFNNVMAGLKENDPNYIEAKSELAGVQSKIRMQLLTLIGGIAAGAGVVIALVFMALLLKRKKDEKFQESALKSLSIESADLDGVAAFSMKQLSTIAKMPITIVYITSRDGNQLVPYASQPMVKNSAEYLEIASPEELSDWVKANGGKPFIYNLERREGTYVKAFPDTPEIIEKYETRIGVPFVIKEKLVGLAYLGIKKTKNILKIRSIFEKNFDKIYQIGKEIAESIENINLYELSVIDELTKVYNKRYFSATLFNEVQKVREHGNPCSLILMDLDHFKNINDTYGHPQGDVVLKKFAACVKSCLRDGIDTMARVGGEEFAVVMPSTSSDDAMRMAESIRSAVESYQLPPPLPPVTVSLGVATFPSHAPTAEELVDRADDALYESKNGGRNKATLSSGFRKPKEEAPYIGEIKKPEGEIPEFVKPWAVAKTEEEKLGAQASLPVKEEAPPVEEKGGEAEEIQEPVHRAPLELPVQSPIEAVIESGETAAPSSPVGAPVGISRPRGSGGRGLLRRTPPPPPTVEIPTAEAVPLPPWAIPGGVGGAPAVQQPAVSKTGAWAPGFPSEPTPTDETIGVIQETPKVEEPAPAPVVLKPAQPPAPKVVEPTLDPVTGYFVKEYYDYRLVQELTAAFQNKKPCAVMFFSIDNVEKSKDKITKEKLEEAIRSVTEQVSLFLKEDTDIPSKYSDEEFAVILPRTNTQMAYNLSEQVRMMLGSMPFSDIGENIKLSFGVASYPEKASSPDELTNRTHEALNSARTAGGNKTTVYS